MTRRHRTPSHKYVERCLLLPTRSRIAGDFANSACTRIVSFTAAVGLQILMGLFGAAFITLQDPTTVDLARLPLQTVVAVNECKLRPVTRTRDHVRACSRLGEHERSIAITRCPACVVNRPRAIARSAAEIPLNDLGSRDGLASFEIHYGSTNRLEYEGCRTRHTSRRTGQENRCEASRETGT